MTEKSILLMLFIISIPAHAQYGTTYIGTEKKSGSMHKWIDQTGKTVYSDSLPPASCTTPTCNEIRTSAEQKPRVVEPTLENYHELKRQKSKVERDNILKSELANEQKNLESAKKQLAEQVVILRDGRDNQKHRGVRLEPYQRLVALHEENIAELKRDLAGIPRPNQNAANSRGIVMGCNEAKLLLTTVAAMKDRGYQLSSAHTVVDRSNEFGQSEKAELRQIISAIYQNNLSPEKAYLAASLSCR